jgi:MSHA biogenesis protein MshQ
VSNSSGLSATLSGIPSGATVLSAQLYWAGSGSTPDYTVTFDGVSKTAASTRSFTSGQSATATIISAAPSTSPSQVKPRATALHLRRPERQHRQSLVRVQGVLGGFALVVVYSHPTEPFRMLNLYEGFQYFRNSSLTINLGNFNVPNPLPANVTGRVGHITWEGDATLSQGGEDLLFNGTALTDSMNPSGNQFNSASNVTGDTASYGVDFDIYTLKSPIIQPGQNAPPRCTVRARTWCCSAPRSSRCPMWPAPTWRSA